MRCSIVPISLFRLLFIGCIFHAAVVQAQPRLTCEAHPDRHSFAIPTPGESGWAVGEGIELSGDQEFKTTLPNGWEFMLLKTDHGWAIRVFDQPYTNGRVDLSAVTPPLRGPANPRDIAGWHFRNSANTGTNLGDVNAPQNLRLFLFDGALAGTGGLRSSELEGVLSQTDTKQGRGALEIFDYELSSLEPNQKASMTQLKFRACLTWPRLDSAAEEARSIEHERRARELDAQIREYSNDELETFGACGLDLTRYQLNARVTPRLLGLDIDGDGAHDQIAQIARIADDRRGLALCRAETWLHLIGFDETFDGPTQHLITAMEAWRIVSPDHGQFGFVDEPNWPAPEGQVLAVERIEKGMAVFFWQNGEIRSQKVYGMVPK